MSKKIREDSKHTDVHSVKEDDVRFTLREWKQERNTLLYLQARCAKSALTTITRTVTATAYTHTVMATCKLDTSTS